MINLVEKLDFPLCTDQAPTGRQNVYSLEGSFLKKLPNMTVPDVSLTLSEVIALYLLKSEERIYKGTDIEKALNTAFAKIGLFAPAGLFDKLNRIKTLFVSPSKQAKDYSGKEDVIDSLTEGMLAKKRCRERKWAKEQRITSQEDGSIILEMKTSGWWDVKKWVLSFGAEAEVLEPKELRKEIMGELKVAERNYALESD